MTSKDFQRLERKLDAVLLNQGQGLYALFRLIFKGDRIMAALDRLEADVAAETTVMQSAITLLQGLKAALDAAGTDPVKLAALADQMEANANSLAAAVAQNTPGAP